MVDRQTYDNHHQEYMNGEHESETEKFALEADGSEEDAVLYEVERAVRAALLNNVRPAKVHQAVVDGFGSYKGFVKEIRAMCQCHD